MKTDYTAMIERCVEFIEANLTKKVSIEQVLEKTYYSYPHFHRVFTDIVGVSLTTYIRNRRLSSAARELVLTDRPIVEIADDCLFASQQTFTRSFKAFFGVSPLKYRENAVLDDLYEPFVLSYAFAKERLAPLDVHIESVPSMHIASHRVYQCGAKATFRVMDQVVGKAWGKLVRWQMAHEYRKNHPDEKMPTTRKLAQFFAGQNLHIPPHTRYFGFADPYPYAENEYGYEAWAMLVEGDGAVDPPDDDIAIKRFDGGLYAVAEATYGPESNLDATWRALHQWFAEQPAYEYGDHQWLEEHLTKENEGGFHGFRVHMAIRAISE